MTSGAAATTASDVKGFISVVFGHGIRTPPDRLIMVWADVFLPDTNIVPCPRA